MMQVREGGSYSSYCLGVLPRDASTRQVDDEMLARSSCILASMQQWVRLRALCLCTRRDATREPVQQPPAG